jgi:hypothetical protein
MLEALWSVQFITSDATVGGGVVVFETQRVFGGDSSFFYLGDYTLDRHQIEVRVKVRRHTPGPQSVFGPLDEFELMLSGEIAEGEFDLVGELVGDPSRQIVVRLTRQANLPTGTA